MSNALSGYRASAKRGVWFMQQVLLTLQIKNIVTGNSHACTCSPKRSMLLETARPGLNFVGPDISSATLLIVMSL